MIVLLIRFIASGRDSGRTFSPPATGGAVLFPSSLMGFLLYAE
jgi:hypothetical protein